MICFYWNILPTSQYLFLYIKFYFTDLGCGKRSIDETNLPYLINGDVAEPGAWPWHIQLLKDGFIQCGGSIINNNWILTAAHCIE